MTNTPRYCSAIGALGLLLGLVGPLAAQCPDGTPPPCSGARRAAVRRAPPPPDVRGRSFLVLPFRNVTRNPDQEWLVEGSPILLADALGRWQELSVVSDERLYPALRRQSLQPGTVMDAAKVRRVAEETGGWTAVTGEVIATGGSVRVSARAYDVVTSREIARITLESQPGEDVRRVFDRVGVRLLAAAGIEGTELDVAGTTTRSLDAYRAYLRGVSHLRRSEVRRARDALLEAVRLDSLFAQAYMRLAEASLAISPNDILDLRSPGIRYADRAAALSDRLPPRQRDLVRAIHDLVHGRLQAARTTLSRLVAADSSDAEVLQWMAGVEGADVILVPAPGGGERPRGSRNAALRLNKLALERDPARHQIFSDLVLHYLQGAGMGQGRVRGFRRELPSLGAFVIALPDRQFVLVLRDTFDLVPAESLSAVPRDSLRAARGRALAAAEAWARQWRQEAPSEADAHLWLSRILDMSGARDTALAALNVADSLGVETGLELVPVRRMALLRRLGRFSEARRIADSLWAAGSMTVSAQSRLDIALEGARVYTAAGEYERADSIVGRLTDLLAAQAPRSLAEQAAIGILTGGAEGSGVGHPATPAGVDSLLAVLQRRPPTGRAARWLPAFYVITARSLELDTARQRAAVLAAVRVLAARGAEPLAYDLMFGTDSATRTAMESEAWYGDRRRAARAESRAVAARLRPLTATVAGDSAVFAWAVSDGDTVTWNRTLSRMLGTEFEWTMSAAGFRVTVEHVVSFDGGARQGTWTQLLDRTLRSVVDTGASGEAAAAAVVQTNSRVRPAARDAQLRFVVRDPTFLAALRRQRPATAELRFQPCPPGPDAPPACAAQSVPIAYTEP